ncbi:hypothetical protein SprV_0501744700 [Sparganum proliferum]
MTLHLSSVRLPPWGVLCVIGGFLYHLALGYFYTVGNMNPYVISYMGIKSSQSAWFSSVILALQAISLPAGGALTKKVGFRPVLLLGILFGGSGIMLTYLTINHGLGAYIATYCILYGLGMGTPYSVIFQVASSWFPAHRATVVGIIASGFGLGALVFTPIQTRIINPNDIQPTNGKYPKEVEERIPRAFLILGGIVLGLEILGTLLMRSCPGSTTQGKLKAESSNNSNVEEKGDLEEHQSLEDDSKSETPVVQQRNFSIKEAVKCVDFYILFGVVFCDVIPVTLLTSTFKVYGIDSHLKDKYLSDIATTCSAFNCVGRIIWGLLVDHFSYKCPLLWLLLQWGILFVTFPYVAAGPAGPYLYAIWIFAIFFTLSGHFVIIPAACTRIFGPQNMATIYGLVYAATAPGALLAAAVISQFDVKGAWIAVYTACAVSCFIAFIISLFLKDEQVRCVGFTSAIARLCDRCRGQPISEETEMESPTKVAVYAAGDKAKEEEGETAVF